MVGLGRLGEVDLSFADFVVKLLPLPLKLARARQMVVIREMKRLALKEGKPWPPRDRRSLNKLLKRS